MLSSKINCNLHIFKFQLCNLDLEKPAEFGANSQGLLVIVAATPPPTALRMSTKASSTTRKIGTRSASPASPGRDSPPRRPTRRTSPPSTRCSTAKRSRPRRPSNSCSSGKAPSRGPLRQVTAAAKSLSLTTSEVLKQSCVHASS